MFVLVKMGRASIAEVAGIFTTRKLAHDAAVEALNNESDDYHRFIVYWTPVNQMTLFWEDEKNKGRIGMNPDNSIIAVAEYSTYYRIHDSVTIDIENLDHDKSKVSVCKNSIEEFAYALLSGDPAAEDAAQDVLSKGG